MIVGGYGGLSTGNIGIVDTTIFDPTTEDLDARREHAHTALVSGRSPSSPTATTSRSAATRRTPTPGPTRPRSTTRPPTPGRCCRKSPHPRSTRRSTRSPTWSRTATCSRSARPRTSPTSSTSTNETWTPVGGASGIINGSSVMYRPGKILYSGGAPSVDRAPPAPATTTSTIDLTAATPKWHQIAPMHNARVYHTLTMLADGTVLAVGGEPTSDQRRSRSRAACCRRRSGIPTTETWSAAAPIAAARNYHSTGDADARRHGCSSPAAGTRTGSATRAGVLGPDLLAAVPVQRARARRSPRPRRSTATARPSPSPRPTPIIDRARSTWSRSAPTPTRATWTSTSCRCQLHRERRLADRANPGRLGARAARQLHAVHPQHERRARRSPRSSRWADPRRPRRPRPA